MFTVECFLLLLKIFNSLINKRMMWQRTHLLVYFLLVDFKLALIELSSHLNAHQNVNSNVHVYLFNFLSDFCSHDRCVLNSKTF